MNTCLECLPCLGKTAVDVAKRSTTDCALQRKILADSLRLLAENDYSMPPSFTAREIFDFVLKYTGKVDLYETEKRQSNHLAKQLVAELASIPEYHEDQFEDRLRLAVAGNILDFSIFDNLDIQQAMMVVKSAFTKPIDLDVVEKLRKKMDSSRQILYILDNCGEAVFDRIFMEPYKDKIILAVRGRPVFNDVSAGDLADCGLAGWKFIENGSSGIPGTILSECSAEFRQTFEESDLIIAKGQGNFETMNEYHNLIAFLFLAKCPVVTRLIGAEQNSIQIRLANI